MGLMPSHIRMLLKLHRKYRFGGRVCVLGNQEIWASAEQLGRYFTEAQCPQRAAGTLHGHTSRLFGSDPDLARLAGDFVHARVLFEMMGFDEYTDLDKFDYDRPAVVHDLNVPVPAGLRGRFGLVLDGGTTEHVFDMRTVMANVAGMVAVGGCVVHLASHDMDHGFYALNPCFFHDYYRVNGFADFACYLMATDYSDVLERYDRRRPYFEYEYGMPLDCLLQTAPSWLVFFAARKVAEVSAPQIPTQGVFAPETGASLRQPRSGFRERVPGWLQPLLAPLRPALRRLRRSIRCRAERRRLLSI